MEKLLLLLSGSLVSSCTAKRWTDTSASPDWMLWRVQQRPVLLPSHESCSCESCPRYPYPAPCPAQIWQMVSSCVISCTLSAFLNSLSHCCASGVWTNASQLFGSNREEPPTSPDNLWTFKTLDQEQQLGINQVWAAIAMFWGQAAADWLGGKVNSVHNSKDLLELEIFGLASCNILAGCVVAVVLTMKTQFEVAFSPLNY